MRFDSDVSTKKIHSIEIENFLGVDLSSSPINVSKKHACYMENLINVDGVNQKRNGWTELSSVGGKINGIFKFKVKRNNQEDNITLIHAGKDVYRLFYDETKDYYELDLLKSNCLNNSSSNAFLSDNKIYIIGGNFLVFGSTKTSRNYEVFDSTKTYTKNDIVEYMGNIYKYVSDNFVSVKPNELRASNYWSKIGSYYSLREVKDDEDTFIPTTTIGITADSVSGEVTKLDDINLLCSKRKNKMLGLDTSELSDKNVSWTVDNKSILKNTIISIDVENENGTINLYNKEGHYNKLYFLRNSLDVECGSADFDTGVITINSELVDIKPLTNEDNITVTYIPYMADDTISKCSFGALFGVNGLSDTLFLSGNPDHPNKDFYSYTVSEDFTYFSEYNSETFGTVSFKINAYVRMSDGTQAIVKENTSSEPTIYYRTASTQTDETTGAVKIVFPITVGAVGEGAVNNFSNGSMLNDNLILSINGLFGLALKSNIATNERYAQERDRYFHSHLIKHSLENAVAVVYKGKFFLSVEDDCYVLDSKYKSSVSGDAEDTFNYECWPWKNIQATSFCVYQNELYFGTLDGKICKFDTDTFKDTSRHIIDGGNLTIEPIIENEPNSNLIIVSNAQAEYICNDKQLMFTNEAVVYSENMIKSSLIRELSISETKIVTITFSENISTIFNKNDKLYIESSAGKTLANVTQISTDEIQLDCKDLSIIDLENVTKNQIYGVLNYKKLFITEFQEYLLDNTKCWGFRLKDKYDNLVKIKGFTVGLDYINADLFEVSEVKSVWYSAPLDLGLNDYSKNLESISVVLDPILKGKMNVGYETRKLSYDLMVNSNSFDFTDIDFNNLTFETAFTSSYTKRIRERNVNYIMFKACSSDDKNSALQCLKVTFTVYKKNRGGR